MRRTNKSAQPRTCGQPLAESVEKRHPAKGDSGQTTVTCTQGQETTSSGLARIREAARRDSKQRFTSLLHHVNVGLLREAFDALKRDAAPGVDGVTWLEYSEGLEECLDDLHDRVHSGDHATEGKLGV